MNEVIANLVAANFLDTYGIGYYISQNSYYEETAYVTVQLWRGWTVVSFTGEYLINAVSAADAKAAMEEFFAALQIDVVAAEYNAEDPEAFIVLNDSYVASYGIFEVDVFESTAAEMDVFAADMYAAGWTIEDGDYEGDYVATWGDTDATVEIQNWNEEEGYGYIRLLCYVYEEPEAPTTAYDLICDIVCCSGGYNYDAATLESYGYIKDQGNDVYLGQSVTYFKADLSDDFAYYLSYFIEGTGRFPSYMSYVQGGEPQEVELTTGDPAAVAYTTVPDGSLWCEVLMYLGSDEYTHIQFRVATPDYFMA